MLSEFRDWHTWIRVMHHVQKTVNYFRLRITKNLIIILEMPKSQMYIFYFKNAESRNIPL